MARLVGVPCGVGKSPLSEIPSGTMLSESLP